MLQQEVPSSVRAARGLRADAHATPCSTAAALWVATARGRAVRLIVAPAAQGRLRSSVACAVHISKRRPVASAMRRSQSAVACARHAHPEPSKRSFHTATAASNATESLAASMASQRAMPWFLASPCARLCATMRTAQTSEGKRRPQVPSWSRASCRPAQQAPRASEAGKLQRCSRARTRCSWRSARSRRRSGRRQRTWLSPAAAW
mmetsp:Transcript_16051/g.49537  ORF Transcript_16051/g.49537 Transcript_16051/m.49537 type:complete len:206 (+) Transcript_16051:124-741(+)